MTAAARITRQLQAHGPAWASTDECAALLLEAAADPAAHRQALDTLDAYGRRQDAEAAARALRASRSDQALHDLPEALERWAADHPTRFAPSPLGEPSPGGWWGVWDEARGCLWLRCDVWADLMRGWGLGERTAIRDLERRGFVLRHEQPSSAGRRQAKKRVGRHQRWCYPLRLNRTPAVARSAPGIDAGTVAPVAQPVAVTWPGAVFADVVFPLIAQ